jgi:site-specific DNA recombinase
MATRMAKPDVNGHQPSAGQEPKASNQIRRPYIANRQTRQDRSRPSEDQKKGVSAMRAVIYARYSTDLQSAASIEDQVRSCKARIEQESWRFITTYSDHAVSGSVRLRPGYQKLLEDARNGAFELVVAEALDRLSRDQEDVAALYKHLTFAGVPENGQLEIELTGALAGILALTKNSPRREGTGGRGAASNAGCGGRI